MTFSRSKRLIRYKAPKRVKVEWHRVRGEGARFQIEVLRAMVSRR